MLRVFAVVSVLIGTVLTGLLSAAVPACACSCIPATPAEALAEADVVFVGTAVQRTGPADPLSPEDATYLFDVEQVVKGPPTADPSYQIATATSEDACGIGFTIGQRYEVFASGTADALRATACGGTRPRAPDTPGPFSQAPTAAARTT